MIIFLPTYLFTPLAYLNHPSTLPFQPNHLPIHLPFHFPTHLPYPTLHIYIDGEPPETAQRFVYSLKDYANDFRVSRNHLGKVKFGVFGLGGSDYNQYFCKSAKDSYGQLKCSLVCN